MKSLLANSIHHDFVQQQFISLIARQSRRVPFGVFIVSVIIAGLMQLYLPLVWAAAWLTVVLVVMALRWQVLGLLPDRVDMPGPQRVMIIMVLSLINGIVFASSLAVFPYLTVAERAMHTLILLGLASGAIATTGGHKKTFLAYAIPTLGTICVLWAWSPGIAQSTWVEHSMSALAAVYLWILVGLAKDGWAIFVESCEIRFQERELNEQLQTALTQADAANRAKTRFLAAASHDLRQPLHTLTLLGSALGMRQLDRRSTEIVRLVNEVTDTLSAQLDGLLDISKLDAGIIQAEQVPMRAHELLTHHFAEISELVKSKGLEPRLVIKTEQLVVSDYQLLLRIVRNLTQNAIRFTERGFIALHLHRTGDKVELEVVDTGCGIAVQHQTQVFQEFYQIDNPERDRSKGLGLGLSIVKRLCDLLNVELRMHSQPGVGTRFSLLLPAANESQDIAPAAEKRGIAETFDLNVLIIDDERSVRVALRTLLEEMGCACMEAASTEEAISAVQTHRPDLVLADFRLRGEDNGITAIRAIRSRWAAVPAVLVSGDTAPDRLLEAERAGIRLLHKPLQLETLQLELAEARRLQDETAPT